MGFESLLPIGAKIIGGLFQSDNASDAANAAAGATTAASQADIAQREKARQELIALLAPYNAAGQKGLGGQLDLLGINGAGPQGQAIAGIQSSPMFTALQAAGERSILSNASATGGLRGGNTQAALAQFSPQLLAQLINDQYTKLGGLTSIGQNAAAGVGNAGMATANGIGGALQTIGAAGAGNALAQGKANAGLISSLTQGAGSLFGLLGNNTGGGLQSSYSINPSASGFGAGLNLGGGIGGGWQGFNNFLGIDP